MSRRSRWKLGLKLAGSVLALYLVAGLALPYISADSYGKQLQSSLGRALGRRVEVRGAVRWNFFRGPGFSAQDVLIHEDPSIGFEPAAYVDRIEVRAGFWPLLIGRFRLVSIRLEDATLNLAKTGETWNFTSFLNRSVMSTVPAIHVRNSRINFKFGNTKSIFYLMNTDLDISPPGSLGGGWSVACQAQAARTDRRALGLGSFVLRGKWYLAPERVDLDLQLERTQLGELAVLVSGQAGGVHGVVTSHLHLAGPLEGIGILGRLNVEDVHRWDLLPPQGHGLPLDIRGRLNLIAQQLELESTSGAVPLTTRFRASSYLSRPRWAVTLTWNRIPIAPVLQFAEDMGAQFPPKLRINGTIDGAVGYSDESGWQGELALHDTAVAIPDSAPLRFEQLQFMAGGGKIWLAPTVVRTSENEEARLEAAYLIAEDTFDLAISSESMRVTSLRAQAALAAVPWLEHVNSGTWKGQLRYHREPDTAAWTGTLELQDAEVAVPGLAHAVSIESARVGIDGNRLAVDRMQARAGEIPFSAEYRYEPGSVRPHRLRLWAAHVNAADLEQEVMPTLRRGSSLLARALGRTTVPGWLRQRKLEGSVQIGDLEVAGTHLQNFRARMVWDVTHVALAALQARLDPSPLNRATVDGSLTVLLGTQSPSYKWTGRINRLNWRGGSVDAEGTLQTSGSGAELLTHLTSEGTFNGAGLDLGALAGSYALAWTQDAPKFRLSDLTLRTDDGIFTGQGSTQEDGRLLILLTNGSREMRMTGTWAALKLDESITGRALRPAP
ncbi:MAG: hypothetical protein JO323_19260 [Acidobacteriia bacterium]|nr:hypothetical protein [Terriglobia bacterium]